MEWQAVVLAVQILLLAAGWLLFQRARGELSARAAETPVLAEVRALQKSVKQLVAEIESAADRQALRLENGCVEAAAILQEIEAAVQDAQLLLAAADRNTVTNVVSDGYSIAANSGIASSNDRLMDSRDAIVVDNRRRPEAVHTRDEQSVTNGAAAAPVQTAASYRDKILSLADSGESAASIARAIRLSQGEVETVLKLRAQRSGWSVCAFSLFIQI